MASKPKQYQIKTVQDMIDCTSEDNINNFLTDLKAVIKMAHAMQDLVNTITEVDVISKEYTEIQSKGFVWIDDGKHNVEIRIEGKK
jgi:hypothetical protein